MALAFFVIAIFVAGHAVSEWLWRRESTRDPAGGACLPFERATSSAILGLALWIALNWLLSGVRGLAPIPLLACAVLAATAGGLSLWRMRGAPAAAADAPDGRGSRWLAAVALTPVVVWLAYILWRGWLLPITPLNYDAVSYHLPKAVLMARAGGFAFFPFPDFRAAYPANYELVLADFLVLAGSDVITEWLSTLMYVLLLLATAALTERWWGRGPQVLAVVLLVASSPVALLHAGAHKNDLMVNVFFVAGCMWTGRWAAHGGLAPLVLLVVCVAMALGTKLHGVMLAAGVAPVLALAALRRRRSAQSLDLRELSLLAVVAVASLLLLGGLSYPVTLYHTGTLSGVPPGTGTGAGYGDWNNLWMFPYLLFTVPLGQKPDSVWAPWSGNYWYWPHYQLYISDLGVVFTLLLGLLPLCIWRYALGGARDAHHRERAAASAATLLAFMVMLPVRLRPVGMFAFLTRFVVFVTPVLAGWTAAPIIRDLARGGRFSRPEVLNVYNVAMRDDLFAALRAAEHTASGLVLACGAVFVWYAVQCGLYDVSAPWWYVMEQARNRSGERSVAFFVINRNRACAWLDRLAGPEDHVAIDGGLDACVYPAYGRELRRKVTFMPPPPDPVRVPEDAQWVMVDHPWNRTWGHPDFKDMSQRGLYIGQGPVQPEDVRVVRELEHDPRFRIVFRNDPGDQVVFKYVGPAR